MKLQVVSTWLKPFAVLYIFLQPATIYAADPTNRINDFHTVLMTAMQTETYEARLALLSPAINQHFELSTVARISLGRNWQGLSPEQQAAHQALLAELVTTTYASRFDRYDGQVFAVTASEPIGRQRMRVRSTLQTKTESVDLDYQLQLKNGEWRIYDVVANGVSDLSLKRSNYASLFATGGLETVQREIRDNIRRNATTAQAE